MTQSPELTQFYQAYQNWLDTGAPQGKPFDRADGLCIQVHCCWTGLPIAEELKAQFWVSQELKQQFRDAGLSTAYPFNVGYEEYNKDTVRMTHHLNAIRNKWVADHLKSE